MGRKNKKQLKSNLNDQDQQDDPEGDDFVEQFYQGQQEIPSQTDQQFEQSKFY